MPSLPNGIIPLSSISSGGYIDIGVAPTSSMSVECSFSVFKPMSSQGSAAAGYIFGARNTNSNSSAGQLNLYMGIGDQPDYVGWQSSRVSQNMSSGDVSVSGMEIFCNISSIKNVFNLSCNNSIASVFTGSTNTFSGTQNIHLIGLNNAGTHLSPTNTVVMYGFNLYTNDTLTRNMLPAYNESTSTAGMYDFVTKAFYPPTSGTFDAGYVLQVQQTEGGYAFIRHREYGQIQKMRFEYFSGDTWFNLPYTVGAYAQEGYEFSHWERNGSTVSNETEYTFDLEENDMTIKAVFVKTTDDMHLGYRAMTINYASTGLPNARSRSFMNVISFNARRDLLQKTSTMLYCDNIPSTVQNNIPLFLYNPKGRIIYCGVIMSIEDNTITCREPLSILDEDRIMKTTWFNAHRTVSYPMWQMLLNSSADSFTSMKGEDFYPLAIDRYEQTNKYYVCNQLMEAINSNSVMNGEDYVIGFFQDYGIAVKSGLYFKDNRYYMYLQPQIPQGEYETLVLGDNIETIKNVNVTSQDAECTFLTIYNSAGTTVRAYYGITKDGQIKEYKTGDSMLPFMAYDNSKLKIVMSDDALETLAKQNLNMSFYNHKITFNIQFGKSISFETLHLGQNVDFYYKDKMYKSILTGMEYSSPKTGDRIKEAKITLGIVRSSITSKLNLGKVNSTGHHH